MLQGRAFVSFRLRHKPELRLLDAAVSFGNLPDPLPKSS